MATEVYCYQVETAPPQCRPQSPPYNRIFRGRGVAPTIGDAEITTISASSRFSSSSQDTRTSRAKTNSVRPVGRSLALLPRQQSVYCIKEQQRAETPQSEARISPTPHGKQQKLSCYLLPFHGAHVPWRGRRRSRKAVTLRASSGEPQPQRKILRLPPPTYASGAARDTISSVSPSCPERCGPSKCSLAPFYLVEQRQSTPRCVLSKPSTGWQLEEKATTTTTTITAPDITPIPRTAYLGRASVRKTTGTAEKAKSFVLITGEKAKSYKRLSSTTASSLPAARDVNSADGKSTGEEFTRLLQKDSRAAAFDPFSSVVRPSRLRRREQRRQQQTSSVRELEKHHRLLLHQRLQRQRQLQRRHWQQQHQGTKWQEQLLHTRIRDSKQLLRAPEQHQRLPEVHTPPTDVLAYCTSTPALASSPKPVFNDFHATQWIQRTPLLKRPSGIPLQVDSLFHPCRASPSPRLVVPSVLADRVSYYQDEENRNLQPQQQRQEKTLKTQSEEGKDRRKRRNFVEHEGRDGGRLQLRARGGGTRFGFAAAPDSFFDRPSVSVCPDQAGNAGEDFSIFVPSRRMCFAISASESRAPFHSGFSPSLIHCPYYAAPRSTTSAVPFVEARTASVAGARTTTAAACNAGSLQIGPKFICDSTEVARTWRAAAAPADVSSSFAGLIPRNHRRAGARDGHAFPCDHLPLDQWLPISYRDVAAASQTGASSSEFEGREQQLQQKDDSLQLQQQNDSLPLRKQQQQQQRSDHHLKKLSQRQQVLLKEGEEQQKQFWRWEDTPSGRATGKPFFGVESSAECNAASPRALRHSLEQEESTTASLDYKSQLDNHHSRRLSRCSLSSDASGLAKKFSSTSSTNFSAMAAAQAASPRRPSAPRRSESFFGDGNVFAKEKSSPAATLSEWNLWKRADVITAETPDGYRWGQTHGRYSNSLYETEATALFQLRLSVRGYKAGQRELHAILGAVAAHIRRLREQQQHDRQQWELLLFRRDTEMQLLRQEKDALKQELDAQMETSKTEIDNLRKRVTFQQQELQELQEQVLQQRHATRSRIEGEVRQEADTLKQKLLETQVKERQVQEELRSLEKRLMNKLDESAKHQEEAERAYKEAQQECTQQKTLIEKLLQEQPQRNVIDELRTAEEQLQLVSNQLSEEKVQRLQLNKELQELCQQLSGERTRRTELEKELQVLMEAQTYIEVEEEESPESSAGKREQRLQGLRKRHLLLQQQRHVQDAALFKATLEAHRAGIVPHVLQHDQALQNQFEELGGVEGGRSSVLRSRRRIGLVEEETLLRKELALRDAKFLQPAEPGERRATVASGQVSSKQEALPAKLPRYSMALPLAWTGKHAKSSSLLYTSTGILTGSQGDESVNYTVPIKVETADGVSGPELSPSVSVPGPVAPAKRILESNVSVANNQEVSLPRLSRVHATSKEGKTNEEINIDAADSADRTATVTTVTGLPYEGRKSVTAAAIPAPSKLPGVGSAIAKPVDSVKDSSASSKSVARSREIISEDTAVAERAKRGINAAAAVSPMTTEGENLSGSPVTSDVISVEVGTPFSGAETKQAALPPKVQLLPRAKPGSVAKELSAAKESQQGVKISEHVAHPVNPPMKKRENTPALAKEPTRKPPLPAPTHIVALQTGDRERPADAAGSLPFEEFTSVNRDVIAKHFPSVEHAETKASKTESPKRDERRKSTVQVKKNFVADKRSAHAKAESAPLSRFDIESRQTLEQAAAGRRKIDTPEGANTKLAKPPSKKPSAADPGVLLREEETPSAACGTGDRQNEQQTGIVVSEAAVVRGKSKSKKDPPSRDVREQNLTAVTSTCESHTVNVKMSCRRDTPENGLKDTDTRNANHFLTERNASVLQKHPPRTGLPISDKAVAQRTSTSEEAVSTRVEHITLDKPTPLPGEHASLNVEKESGVGGVSNRTRADVSNKKANPLKKAASEAEEEKERRSSGLQPQRDITEERSAAVDSLPESTPNAEKDIEYLEVASSTTGSSVEGGDGGKLDLALSGTFKHIKERIDEVRQLTLPTDTGGAKERTSVSPVSVVGSVPLKQGIQKDVSGEMGNFFKYGMAERTSEG